MMKSAIYFVVGALLSSFFCFLSVSNHRAPEGAFVVGMIDRLLQEEKIEEDVIEGFMETSHIGAFTFRNGDRSIFTLAHKQGTYPKFMIEHQDSMVSIFFADGKDVTIKFDPSTRLAEFISVTIDQDGTKKSFVDRGLTGKFNETFIFKEDGIVERHLINED